ncbi:MAG: methyltransferase, partial [Candidatus Omnitrophica bacterium]|nr:methyltransferase [Candidatus Omnitrophota bacterium]
FNTKDSDWRDIVLPNGAPAQYPSWFQPTRDEDGAWNAFTEEGVPIARMPSTGTFFDQTCFPYLDGYPDDFNDLTEAMGKILWAALVHSPWDHISEKDFWSQLREKAIVLRENSDRAIMVVVGCNLFEWGTFLRRMDNFLMDLIMDPKKVESLLDALMECHLANLSKVCDAVGDVVDIVRFGDDLGMDRGPFMSPKIYRSLFKPRHAILCDYVRKHSRMHTFLHSCGSIYKLLPDLIEAGFEIINPVQTNCVDMEPAKLKKEFGKDLTFWGGFCDTRHILNRATPEEVKDHVRKRIEILSPGGGAVFNTVHNILPEVPPENIVAMFEAVDDYR